MNRNKWQHLIWLFVLPYLFTACKEKTPEPATDSQSNAWILDQMKYWYYWNDKLPASPDLSKKPDAFFTSLLYAYDAVARPDGDRFSWIQESAEELKASLSGETKTTGMHYKLVYYPSGSNDVLGIVQYTLPGSPAAKAGIKRGDIFSGINGQKMTGSNYQALLKTEGALTFTLSTLADDGSVKNAGASNAVLPVIFQEDPVHFDTTFQYSGNKIGYLVYHQFIPGPNEGNATQYDQKLESIFAKFKSSQVNALVLDLRYNPGGYVSSATVLASLIGKVTTNDIFYYKEYNSRVTPDLEKKFGKGYFYEKFASKTQNVGAQLNDLIILTSKRSASASELLINGLKPFMKVTLIGDVTVGKNVGSVTLSNEKAGIKWGLQPIVTKSFNGLKQSDYSTGFKPDVSVIEGNRLFRYGDPRDPLLGEALYQIVGSRVARKSAETSKAGLDQSVEIMSTVEQKAGGSNMFFDK